MDDHKNDEMSANQQQVNDMAEVADDSRRVETATRVGVDKCIDDDNVNKGIASEISLANLVNHGEQYTSKDVMEKRTLDEVVGPSRDGLRALDGPTNESGSTRP